MKENELKDLLLKSMFPITDEWNKTFNVIDENSFDELIHKILAITENEKP